MDIAALNLAEKSDTPQSLEVLHPLTGQKTGFVAQVVGIESTKKRHFLRNIQDEMWKRAKDAFVAGEKSADLSDQEKDVIDARIAAAVIVGWSGLTENGVEVPFSEEKAVEILVKNPWLQRQVERAHRDEELFFGSKPTNS